MPLTELSIAGYRGFARRQNLRIAVPDGVEGSGLTIVVGPNNSGKSAIIEVMHLFRAPGHPIQLVEGQKNATSTGRVQLRLSSGTGYGEYVTRPGGKAEWQEFGLQLPGTIYTLPARRGFDSRFQAAEVTRAEYTVQMGSFAERRQQSVYFYPRLYSIERNSDAFNALFSRVVEKVPSWYLERRDNGDVFMKITSASAPHDSDGLGQGMISLLYIIDALYDSEAGDVICIDEPELSLHPAAQRALARILAEYAADRQIIFATHSPYFAALEYLQAGATIARVSECDGASTINQLSPDVTADLYGFLRDALNPHVLGIQAREVLFLEGGVILVEGQDDVIGYTSIAQQLNVPLRGTFYGWGVGGAYKMRAIARMLNELGFRRVVGILDAGEKGEKLRLENEFPQYRFFCSPAADVRTKALREQQPEIQGLLDRKGKLKEQFVEDMQCLFADIARAMNVT